MKLTTLLTAIALVTTACQSGAFLEVVSTDVVDRSYKRGAIKSNFAGTRIEVAAKAKEYQGKVMLCVAVVGDGVGTFGPEWPGAVADALIVKLDNQRLVSGTSFAKVYLKDKTTMGKSAQCALTSRAWQAKYGSMELEFDLPRVTLSA